MPPHLQNPFTIPDIFTEICLFVSNCHSDTRKMLLISKEIFLNLRRYEPLYRRLCMQQDSCLYLSNIAAAIAAPSRLPSRGHHFHDLYWHYEFDGNQECRTNALLQASSQFEPNQKNSPSAPICLLRYNWSHLKWEFNEELLNWISQCSDREIATVCLVDMEEDSSLPNEDDNLKSNSEWKQFSTDDRDTYQSFGAHFLSDMLTEVYNVFSSSPHKTSSECPLDACIMVYPHIRRSNGNAPHSMLIMRAYGLFDKAPHARMMEESLLNLRRMLMETVLVSSSCVLLCKKSSNYSWMNRLEEVLPPLHETPLFGTPDDKRSIIVCTDSSSTDLCHFEDNHSHIDTHTDLFEEIRQQYLKNSSHNFAPTIDDLLFGESNAEKPESSDVESKDTAVENHPFAHYMLSWFGRHASLQLHSTNTHSNAQLKRFSRSLFSCIQQVSSPLNFGYPLSRWTAMRPLGALVSQLIRFWFSELEKVTNSPNPQLPCIQSVIQDFGTRQLREEMQRLVDVYSRATQMELSPQGFDMEKLVLFSERHAHSVLKTFNMSIQEALFPNSSVEQMLSLMKHEINNKFRELWIQNADNSAQYCEKIYENVFKWVHAELECPSESFLSDFGKNFLDCVDDVYLKAAQGTRSYHILSFMTIQLLNQVEDKFPALASDLKALIQIIDEKAIENTLCVDAKRARLQRVSALRLKLLSIDLSLERLSTEIELRRSEEIESASCREQVEYRLKQLNLTGGENFNARVVRELYISSCEDAIALEKTEREKYARSLEEAERSFKDTRLAEWKSGSVSLRGMWNDVRNKRRLRKRQ